MSPKGREYKEAVIVGLVTTLAFMGVTFFIWYSATLMDRTALYLAIIFSTVLSLLLGLLSAAVRFNSANLERLVRERTVELEKKAKALQIQTERAEEAARLKDQFVATMSHELKTPLNAIIGFSEILLEGLQGALNAKQRDSLTRLYGSAQELFTLVSNVLDLSKTEGGQMGISIAPLRPNDVLDEVMRILPALLKEKDVEIEARKDPELGEVEGDAVKIRQILSNLITNAIKFTKKGKITITTERRGAHYIFRVEDTGIGVPKEILPYLFEAFRQADGSVRREYGGTGLGLHIVKNFVESLHGEIALESEVGKGTTVTVRLPVRFSPAGENP